MRKVVAKRTFGCPVCGEQMDGVIRKAACIGRINYNTQTYRMKDTSHTDWVCEACDIEFVLLPAGGGMITVEEWEKRYGDNECEAQCEV